MEGEIGCERAGTREPVLVPIPAERAKAPVKRRRPPARSGHVLVVEDNAVNRMLIGAYLEEFGLTYDVVENGARALKQLAAKDYDLVLMDIMMPELDGVETTKRIRKMGGEAGRVPIVALTAHAMKGDREDYLAAGMDGYVSKPIRGRRLFGALKPYLSDTTARRPASSCASLWWQSAESRPRAFWPIGRRSGRRRRGPDRRSRAAKGVAREERQRHDPCRRPREWR
jgi:CheY-like chemotaxis protein